MNLTRQTKILSFALLLLAIVAEFVSAEIQDTAKKDGGFLAVPIIYYAPETGWATGGRLAYYKNANPSNIYLNLFISQKLQFEIFLGSELYKSDWRVVEKAKWSRWTDSYYGIGNSIDVSSKAIYTDRFFWGYLSVQKLFGPVYVGLEADGRKEEMTDPLPGNPPGNNNWYYGGLGMRLTYDTRDNKYYTQSGRFLESSVREYLPISRSISFQRLIIDYRDFHRIFKSHYLALQAKADLCHGDVPLQVMPCVGDVIRGYETSLYRDKMAVSTQLEYRFPIWRIVSGTAFLGVGDVFAHADDVTLKTLKVAGGVGLRFRLNDNGVNLRFDAATIRNFDDFSMYVSLGEAF